MAMNPRLLRPLASGFLKDADAIAYVAAVEAADGQKLEKGVALAYESFITGCKADGIWDAIKASCILAGARTLAGALTPLVGSAPTNNNFVSGDYDRATGLAGDESTKYLDSNRNNNADPQDDKHVALYVSAAATGIGNSYLGSSTNNIGSTRISTGSVDVNWRLHNSSTASVIDVANADLTGFAGMSRAAATGFDTRAQGATVPRTQPSSTPENANIHIFAHAAAKHANCRLAFYSIGESLDLADLDTRVSTLITAIGAAI